MSAQPILYYFPISSPALSVLLVAKALNIELDLRVVDLVNGDQNQPEFRKLNPQQTVPTLDDNGSLLWDSHAIITYLVGKYGKSDDHPLYPKDFYTRARIDQRLHFESGILFDTLKGLVGPIIFEGATEITEKQIHLVLSSYEILEKFLAVDLYLVGDHLTVADFSVVTSLTQLAAHVELDATKYPKITAYIERLEQLPYFHEINSVIVAKLRLLLGAIIAKNKAAAAGVTNL